MKFSRIKFSKEATEALEKMKGKVGLNWNILCRIGYCISLNDPQLPDPKEYKQDGAIEIDRKILMGDEDELYVSLIRQQCISNKIAEERYFDFFRAHMNRGVLLLSKRINNVKELGQLLPS